MRGIFDLDFLCRKEIFKFLSPLDLCSVRQSCTQLKDFVDDYCESIYYEGEQCLDLREENIRDVSRILKNYGKCVRRLKVGLPFALNSSNSEVSNLLLDVIATNCRKALKSLSLYWLQLNQIENEKLTKVFNNLAILELIGCRGAWINGNQKSFEIILLGQRYPNLRTLKVKSSQVTTSIYKKFFMRPRNIKKFHCYNMDDNILPLMAQNAVKMEELDIRVAANTGKLVALAQLSKLKRLEIGGVGFDERATIDLINELSVKNQLEMLALHYFEFNDELFHALSNLTNLNKLRLTGTCTVNDTNSIEILSQNLTKLESLMLVNCVHFPYRNFLTSVCKSGKFRSIYVWEYGKRGEINNFIEQLVREYSGWRGHRSFVEGGPLSIYLYEETYKRMKDVLTENNLKSIERYGNIEIRRATFEMFLPILI